ncbi:MBL fold metallo-hydrolase [Paenibacillus flagellatus]|uniref:Carbon-phosphorus lyase n=1 Tax=Paenibacillus flagellatus TaxID=2211139 RepID=A0A2V5JVM1_9BACL|nr:MBL fold metallo-hydrolase [Paenibacillus flagellatus]PYI50785.1 carbon-phosphorus lyase [Paenibacillus flagellatus]
MQLHFLGTAAAEGIPNAFCRCDTCREARRLGGKNIRTRSSVIIDRRLKVDFSADSYMQALRDDIDLGAIEHLLVTHTHYDHYHPQDLYNRVEGFAHGLDGPLHIYGNDNVIRLGIAAVESGSERYRFHRLLPFRPFSAGEYAVTPLLADHDRNETCLLYVIEKDGRKLLYGNDTGWFPEETWAWLQGKRIDYAILDCTHAYTNNPRNRNHMSIETIVDMQRAFREQGVLAENGRITVTHFTHNAGLQHDDWVRAFAPYGIEVAYDGKLDTV